jgi:hypothetical protein
MKPVLISFWRCGFLCYQISPNETTGIIMFDGLVGGFVGFLSCFFKSLIYGGFKFFGETLNREVLKY